MCNSITKARLRPFWPGVMVLLIVFSGFLTASDCAGQTSSPKPDKNVKVVKFTPEITDDLRVNFLFEFSNHLVAQDSLNNVLKDFPLVISPGITGIARWIETDVLRFYPDKELAPATIYTLKVKSDDSFIHGNRISDKSEFIFSTPPLRVQDSRIRQEYVPKTTGRVRLVTDIRFNYPVEVTELRRKLKIEGLENADKSSLKFEIQDRSAVVRQSRRRKFSDLPPVDQFAREVTVISEPFSLSTRRQRYRLKIDKGLGCKHCGDIESLQFVTETTVGAISHLVINDVSGRLEGNIGVVRIRFSRSVIADGVEDFISVTPEVNFRLEARRNQVVLKGNFESGKTYTVDVTRNLPTADGSSLQRDYSGKVKMPDRPASVKFASPGVFLPKKGARFLEVETVNVPELTVDLEQVFANNIIYALVGGHLQTGQHYWGDMSSVGRRFFTTDKKLASENNEDLTTTIDIGSIVGDTLGGVFRVTARNREGRWTSDSRLVMMTDLGISARMAKDYLMVWVNTLSESSPVKKATVRLISRNNQVLLSGKTDSRGIVVFDDVEEKTKGFSPYLIIVSHENDLAYLRFSECLIHTANFDVSGRPYLDRGYEAFVYSDRGVYRPGDTVHLASIVRGVGGSTPPEFPYTVTVYEPSGRKFDSYTLNTSMTGFNSIDFDVPAFARTGKYTATAHIGDDYVIGSYPFQVEEFVPDKIKVTLKTDQEAYESGDTVKIDVDGKFLFGPPTSGHKVTGSVTLESHRFATLRYSDYTFENSDRKFSRTDVRLKDDKLDEDGKYQYEYNIPKTYTPSSSLKGLISASVSEEGGRAVSGYSEVVIHPYIKYAGLKINLEGYATPGEPFTADVVAVNPDGTAVAGDTLDIRFYRLVYHSILKLDNTGRYRYVSERTEHPVDSALVVTTDAGGTVTFTPPEYGNFKLVATHKSGGHSAARTLYASGWGYAPWAMDQPDRIELDFDREKYEAGETAVVQVRAPFGGKLLVTIEKESVLDFITFDMEENTAEFNVKVKKDYGPNAYVTATIVKEASDVDRTSPARAFGVAPLMVSTKDKAIGVDISGPKVVKPNTQVTFDLKTDIPGTTEMTVAAVDEGILQLTDFSTPDPLGFFHGKRSLHLRGYDIYSFIYPEVQRATSHLSAPGGAADLFAAKRKRHLSPVTARRIKSVALWSGVVRTDAEGNASVSFDIPEFNGRLRVMAVAVQGDRVGSSETDLIVRDKIVVQESFPRFLSPGDKVDGLVTLYNNTGGTATIDVTLTCDGPVEILSGRTRTVTLENNAEGKAVFQLKAGMKPGRISCNVTASDGTERSGVSFELPNRPAQPLQTMYGSGTIGSNESEEITLEGNWLEGTDEMTLQLASLSAVGFARNINYLLKYPYGCVEQTTSRVMPLIYFNDLARFADKDLAGGRGAEYFVEEGIIRLMGMMQADGLFSYWPNGRRIHYWSSVYASHCVFEAKKAGYEVDDDFYKTILRKVKDIALGKNQEIGVSERVYAGFALARAGKLERKVVNYLKSLDAGSIPVYSKYQLAAVLYAAGDEDEAKLLLPVDVQPAVFDPETGGTFSSGIRTNAILLEVLNEIDPTNPSCAALAKSLTDNARIGKWYTTQETAFALMALGKFFAGQSGSDYTGTVTIPGEEALPFDTADFKVTRTGLGMRKLTVILGGTGPCFYFWQSSGVPADLAPDEFSRGIKVSREYLTADGESLDLTKVQPGEQVIGHIKVETTENTLFNVVINDLLPAGFEIENPRLKTSPRLSWVPDRGSDIEFQDIRDDRLLLFTDLRPKRPVEFYYSLRAIASGEFVIPPVAAECMYNPVVAGASSSGILVIGGSEEE